MEADYEEQTQTQAAATTGPAAPQTQAPAAPAEPTARVEAVVPGKYSTGVSDRGEFVSPYDEREMTKPSRRKFSNATLIWLSVLAVFLAGLVLIVWNP